MKLESNIDLGRVERFEELRRFCSILINQLSSIINGNIEFGQNIKTVNVDVAFGTADQAVLIPHTLRKVPTGFMLIGTDVATNLYGSTSTWNATHVTLSSSAVANVRIMLF